MTDHFDACPSCGQMVFRGAMRCVGCGKILKTPEEQARAIERLRKSHKRGDMVKILKFMIFLAVIGITYHFFSDHIIAFAERLVQK